MTIGLIVAVIFGSLFLITIYTGSSAARAQEPNADESSVEVFKIAGWVRLLIISEILMSGSFLLLPFFTIQTKSSWLLFGILSAVFFTIGAIAYYKASKMFVHLDPKVLKYHDGSKLNQVERENVLKVYLSSGFIVVDTGEIPRLTIPLVFGNSQRLYSMLCR